MKKIFTFFAAMLCAGSMFAASIELTASNFKSSYGKEAITITVGDVEFTSSGIQYNNKNTPSGSDFASKQFIQFRRSASNSEPGELKNVGSLALKSITIATYGEANFTLSAGVSAEGLSEVTKPEGKDGKFTCKDTEGQDKEVDVKIYTFDVQGKRFFDLVNGNAATYAAYITIELDEGGESALEQTAVAVKAQKMIRDGQLLIIKNGVTYDITGQVVK